MTKTVRMASPGLLAGLLVVVGCGDAKQFAKDLLGVESDDHVDIDAPQVAGTPDVGSDERPPEPTSIPKQPLERSLSKFPFLAKGAPNLGFKLTSLDQLYALEIEPDMPKWGAPTADDPAAVVDGDLETAWTCVPADPKHCTLSVHFTGPAQVKAVRIFAAGGTSSVDNDAHPRPKQLRLHTAGGFAEANIPDSGDYVYVVLGKDVETPNLSIEFTEFWKGSGNELKVAEVEVFGTSGEARAALEVVPERTFVTWDQTAWRKKGAEFRPAETFVRQVNADGSVQTLAAGSALRGKQGDRAMLMERLQDGTCTRVEGTVHLLDTGTRVVAPLGELGGIGGDLFRHSAGNGVALGFTDEFSTTLAGVVIDPERGYVVKRTPLREDKRKTDTFGDWGFEALIVPRRGTPLAASTPGCARATEEQLATAAAALRGPEDDAGGKKKARPKDDVLATPEDWTVCTAGNTLGFFSDSGTCGGSWHMLAVSSDGELQGQARGTHRGSHVGLRRLSGDELLIEATGLDDSGTVARLTPEGLTVLTEHGALAVPPPGACRNECGDRFPNPHAPDW